MAKKFLNIFKRDKSVFSDEELKWQAKIGNRIDKIILVIIGLIGVLLGKGTIQVVGNMTKNVNDPEIAGVIWLVGILVMLLIDVIIAVIFAVGVDKVLRLKEIDAQLQKNSKEEQTRKLLSCIEAQDFSELGIEWAMIDEIFRLCLKSGIIEIKPSVNGVKVSLSELIKDVDPVVIEKDKLLTYFDFETEEDDEEDEN